MLGMRKFKTKTFILKNLKTENCKTGDPLRFFNIHSVVKYHTKLKGGPLGTFETFRKNRANSKRGEVSVPKKWKGGPFYFGMLVKKLAHTHQFEHKTSGLKSKHLATRPRTPELCNLPAGTSCRAEKRTHTYP